MENGIKIGKVIKEGINATTPQGKLLVKHGLVRNIDTSEFKKGDVLYLDPNKPGGLKTMTKIELLNIKLTGLIQYQKDKTKLIGIGYENTLEHSVNELKIAWIKLKIAIIELFTF